MSTRTEVNYPELNPAWISFGQSRPVREARQAVKAETALKMRSDALLGELDRWQGVGNGKKVRRTEGWPMAMQYHG